VADAVGFGAACDYLAGLGMDAVHAHELDVTRYAWEQLLELPEVEIYGPPPEERGGVIAFNVGDVHAHDVASILDEDGVAIRAGHHCAQPLHSRFGLAASARASFYVYNSRADVDRLIDGLRRVRSIFAQPGA
jgi:cysteine desulfurase/selenocysteine lyase